MGNCFGKSSSSSGDQFSGPGRAVGSAPTTVKSSSAAISPSQGRTLGSGPDTSADDPRGAAARAAEERAKAKQGKGKLGKQLDAQKSKTQSAHLAQASMDNRAAREADAQGEIRAYS
ncbi:hypothetical protein MBLNU457_5581t1 [Dothideomycetes sp. NU457]